MCCCSRRVGVQQIGRKKVLFEYQVKVFVRLYRVHVGCLFKIFERKTEVHGFEFVRRECSGPCGQQAEKQTYKQTENSEFKALFRNAGKEREEQPYCRYPRRVYENVRNKQPYIPIRLIEVVARQQKALVDVFVEVFVYERGHFVVASFLFRKAERKTVVHGV